MTERKYELVCQMWERQRHQFRGPIYSAVASCNMLASARSGLKFIS